MGGATYNNWAALNTAGIRRFVDTFGLDGVDIDYEVWFAAALGGRLPLPFLVPVLRRQRLLALQSRVC